MKKMNEKFNIKLIKVLFSWKKRCKCSAPFTNAKLSFIPTVELYGTMVYQKTTHTLQHIPTENKAAFSHIILLIKNVYSRVLCHFTTKKIE